MIARNREQGDDETDGLAKDLAALARRLDAERYPGRAWPASAPRPARGPAVQRTAWLAAAAVAAGVCAAMVYHAAVSQPAANQVSGVRGQGSGGASVRRGSPDPAVPQVPAELAASQAPVPQVVVVEDLDSYSFIDLTAGAPVVSYATKDCCSPTCVVAVLR